MACLNLPLEARYGCEKVLIASVVGDIPESVGYLIATHPEVSAPV